MSCYRGHLKSFAMPIDSAAIIRISSSSLHAAASTRIRTTLAGVVHFLQNDFEGYFTFRTKREVTGTTMTMSHACCERITYRVD